MDAVFEQTIRNYTVILNQNVSRYSVSFATSVRSYNIINQQHRRTFNVVTIQPIRNYQIIVNNLGSGKTMQDIVLDSEFARWHPDGLVFAYELVESEDGDIEVLSFTDGFVFIHNWYPIEETNNKVPYIPVLPPVSEIDPTLQAPVFLLGEESTRRVGSRVKSYISTAANATTINYSLDTDSLIGGNKINALNGEVIWAEAWEGESVITATATGVGGPLSSTHTVTSKVDTEEDPVFDTEDILPVDSYATHRKVRVAANKVKLESEDLYYIMLKFPENESVDIASIVVSTRYYRELIYEGYANILMGVLNSKAHDRIFSLEWGNVGAKITKTKPPVVIQTRWFILSETCLLDVNGKNTGQQEVHKKKQKLEGTEWVDLLEETTDVITNTTACPIPVPPPPNYFMSVRVGQAFGSSTEIPISFTRNQIPITTPRKTGSNYIFFSTPEVFGRPTILNSLNKDISYQFEDIGPDIKAGFEPNKIWKRSSTFVTTLSTTFYLKV